MPATVKLSVVLNNECDEVKQEPDRRQPSGLRWPGWERALKWIATDFRGLVGAVECGNELDLVVRRGRSIVFVEVKRKSGDRFGDPLEMVGPEKVRRVRRAAEAWLAAHREADGLELSIEVVAVRGHRVERVVVTS